MADKNRPDFMAGTAAAGSKNYKPTDTSGGPNTNISFGDAFKSARKQGKKTFTYKGKKYTTETKDEQKAKPKKEGNIDNRKDFSDEKMGPPSLKAEKKDRSEMGRSLQKKAQASMGFKKGGSVKKCKRDGIAKRGRTRCKGSR